MHIYIYNIRIYIYSSKTLELPELVKLLAVLAHFSSLKFIASTFRVCPMVGTECSIILVRFGDW